MQLARLQRAVTAPGCINVDSRAHQMICEMFDRQSYVSVDRTSRLVDVRPSVAGEGSRMKIDSF